MKKFKRPINIYLEDWQKASDELCDWFAEKYFGQDNESWWIADEIGSVLFVNDYFFNLSDIVDFVRYEYSRKMMFAYYDYRLEFQSDKKYKNDDYLINIKNYKYVKKTTK